MMEKSISESYIASDSIDRIDFEKVSNMLKHAYWSQGIGAAEVKKGALNSALVVAAYHTGGDLAGYLRVISDKTRFAYILDVYVHEAHRKNGIAKAMVRFAMDHPDLADVYQWLLITMDAHEVYRAVGFGTLVLPERWMCIMKQRPVR